MNVPCNSCKESRNCQAKGEMHRVTAFAFFSGHELPTCPFYSPAYFRGVEGVFYKVDPASSVVYGA